jgi:acylphosphatase
MSSTHTVLHRRLIHFTGRVQGVGFRYTVKNVALPHSVQGYVRNLPDGRVELLMEGPDHEMDEIIDSIKQKMAGFIRRVDVKTTPSSGEFRNFDIRH